MKGIWQVVNMLLIEANLNLLAVGRGKQKFNDNTIRKIASKVNIFHI